MFLGLKNVKNVKKRTYSFRGHLITPVCNLPKVSSGKTMCDKCLYESSNTLDRQINNWNELQWSLSEVCVNSFRRIDDYTFAEDISRLFDTPFKKNVKVTFAEIWKKTYTGRRQAATSTVLQRIRRSPGRVRSICDQHVCLFVCLCLTVAKFSVHV